MQEHNASCLIKRKKARYQLLQTLLSVLSHWNRQLPSALKPCISRRYTAHNTIHSLFTYRSFRRSNAPSSVRRPFESRVPSSAPSKIAQAFYLHIYNLLLPSIPRLVRSPLSYNVSPRILGAYSACFSSAYVHHFVVEHVRTPIAIGPRCARERDATEITRESTPSCRLLAVRVSKFGVPCRCFFPRSPRRDIRRTIGVVGARLVVKGKVENRGRGKITTVNTVAVTNGEASGESRRARESRSTHPH